MQSFDILIIVAYFVVILMIGVWLAVRRLNRRDRSDCHTDDSEFFLAGRSMHWLPIGLSITLTAFSGINYTAFSGEVFSHGLYVALSLPVFIFVALPVIRVIMPFYHHLGICSAYEYLEKRFDWRVRTLASGLFILWRTFWMATALYVPAKVLSLLTGMNINGLILLTGLVVTFYSAVGGIKAVIWTDVFQFVVLIGGLFAILVLVGLENPEGFGGIMRRSAEGGLLKPFYPFDPAMFSLDPRIRITLWSSWIGTFVAFMARYGVDQNVVQRYLTAKTLRTAQIAFHLNYLAAIWALLSLAFMGFAIYNYSFHSGIIGQYGNSPLAYFSLFIRSLPAGAVGLVVVGLIAATMSSIDSGINSCCTAFITDFYRRFRSHANISSDAPKPGIGLHSALTALFGIIATIAAMSVGQLGTIFEIANKIINGFGSPLLAIFILGMFSRTANCQGMLTGGIIGTVWSACVSFFLTGIALHYYAVLNLIGVLVLCCLASLVLGTKPSPEQLEWTWKMVRKNLNR